MPVGCWNSRERSYLSPQRIMLSLPGARLSPPPPKCPQYLAVSERRRPTWIACCSFCLGGNCHSSGSGSGSGWSSYRKCRTCFNGNNRHLISPLKYSHASISFSDLPHQCSLRTQAQYNRVRTHLYGRYWRHWTSAPVRLTTWNRKMFFSALKNITKLTLT